MSEHAVGPRPGDFLFLCEFGWSGGTLETSWLPGSILMMWGALGPILMSSVALETCFGNFPVRCWGHPRSKVPAWLVVNGLSLGLSNNNPRISEHDSRDPETEIGRLEDRRRAHSTLETGFPRILRSPVAPQGGWRIRLYILGFTVSKIPQTD